MRLKEIEHLIESDQLEQALNELNNQRSPVVVLFKITVLLDYQRSETFTMKKVS